MKLLANNKKAYHDYFIEEKYEAGLSLLGSEVKSIKKGKVSIKESFISDRKGEMFIYGMHVTPYSQAYDKDIDPTRTRRLLLHKKEINKLIGKKTQAGYTVVPLKIYERDGLVKLELALAKGKKQYDKRESIKAKDDKRKMDRALKNY
ncbi:Small protein B [Anaerococcus prevotii]|uniref:SsrA-binding protein n=1 Tax=Anaerococcus prevotii (strain ATCC 9321 / DSM 20548 / JCM 6508 / NCTC 11806 / PC1) TaxID=525919 RepID=C7RH38_ANAPD|nr:MULTISPECIES: SsrA-binding protein SmpB [Anaerococcus]MDD6918236.1 SsrA-binding protein SmpB [Peptoniphilaceae bacterium]ACV28799.1 SsrA-binding protein [Anaerococcus prevotii DSM 20548]MCI5971775.1 SsrA-binding protein SmpB [Anaerococcus sp.]MDU2557510.1 SsrA-binding protein SmpB [Anaerococcus prevotii]MDY2927832.1 SsrA-binding protein SmpB [Anaerococcus sp.]